MNRQFGLVRVSAAVPRVSVADPVANATEMLGLLEGLPDSDIIVFPELSISSYTCGQLFHQQALLDETEIQLRRLASDAPNKKQLIIVGAPLRSGTALYNCSVVINNGKIIGATPKQFVPNYNEFYESRYFASGDESTAATVRIGETDVPFGTQLLFTHGGGHGQPELVVYTEICEAIWMPIPPSSLAAIAGANVLCNISASPETIGKAGYRRDLVTGQSGRCIAAYAYSSCGPTESTADLVYGGHAMIAQGGHLLTESSRVGDTQTTKRDSYAITSDVDIEMLQTERRNTTTFIDSERYLGDRKFKRVPFELTTNNSDLIQTVNAMPFVPAAPETLAARCTEVFGIQTSSLAKRLDCLGKDPKMVIGISGGLDSTLALLVATKTCDLMGIPRRNIRGVTMPGFGTTSHTLNNAHDLMQHLDVEVSEIDIRKACLQEFYDLARATGYQPFGQIDLLSSQNSDLSVDDFVQLVSSVPETDRHDLVFENVQARRRTELLMNMGFVLGTGDMSEMWLGWCTYNADQQSMYNVNCSIPKTLVKFLVEYVATNQFDGEVRETLLSNAKTAISPELLPVNESTQEAQSTEDTVGPYELHDFFMFNLARYGFSPKKILFLASQAEGWSKDYSRDELLKWLKINITRAFSQQYKRDNVPNGPKVGSLSLSPRGDWRMPSDASAAAWLDSLDE